MAWKLIVFVALTTFAVGLCLTDLEKQCIATYNEDFDNSLLEGTWYRIMEFTLIANMIPTIECPTFVYDKPNATELTKYKEEYLTPDIPYSFDDHPLHVDGGSFRHEGLLIGNKQAKFFIMDPNTHLFRTLYDVRIYERINDNYAVFHECKSRGFRRWLMSRNRNPSREEVETIVKNDRALSDMRRQWYCAVM